MLDFILFLHGRYQLPHLSFYRRLARGRFKVAVDGGYSFFRKAHLRPDLLIGDFDSLKRLPKDLSPRTDVIVYPADKDKTDAELALDYCLERKAKRIDIVQPSLGEPDHFVGNLMLLAKAARSAKGRRKSQVRLVNANSEVLLLDSGRWAVRNAQGDSLSIIPISERIVLSCRGTEYDVTGLRIRRGETVGLRNRVTAARASVEIRGQGLLFHRSSGW